MAAVRTDAAFGLFNAERQGDESDPGADRYADRNPDRYAHTDADCDAFLYAVPSVYEEIDAQTSELGIQLKDAILAYRAG